MNVLQFNSLTTRPVDLSVWAAGSVLLYGPDVHHAGPEDIEGSSSSPSRIPLRWYQGKNQLNSPGARPPDQPESRTST